MVLYKPKIIEKDESFFLNNNYTEIVNNVQSDGLESIITKLKNYWNSMSSGNKEKIWEYLNSLIKLSDLIK